MLGARGGVGSWGVGNRLGERKQEKGNPHGRSVTQSKVRHFEANVMRSSSLSMEHKLSPHSVQPLGYQVLTVGL